jgi:hypothetical protein
MSPIVRRHGYRAAVATLAAGILLVSAFLLAVAVPDLTRSASVAQAPQPSASPSTTPLSPMALSPVGIQMAGDADCAACHVTTNGTVGTRDVPVMGHPLWGWRDCTACHATGRLVATAPGHSSLHKDDCLVCHKPPEGAAASAPPAPHHIYTDKPCLSCHGKPGVAPLPTDMAGRNDCWICHSGNEYKDLFSGAGPSDAPSASPLRPSIPPGEVTQ